MTGTSVSSRTGNLDSTMAGQVLELLEQINEQGTTVVMVTHDPDLAARARRNIQLLDGRVMDENDSNANLQPVAAYA